MKGKNVSNTQRLGNFGQTLETKPSYFEMFSLSSTIYIPQCILNLSMKEGSLFALLVCQVEMSQTMVTLATLLVLFESS